jgi:hypothetical protein
LCPQSDRTIELATNPFTQAEINGMGLKTGCTCGAKKQCFPYFFHVVLPAVSPHQDGQFSALGFETYAYLPGVSFLIFLSIITFDALDCP